MNPFDALSDDPILHIFSFLPGKDLLKLSVMDRKFKRIVTTSKETMEKIRLVIDCYNLDDVIETTSSKTRQFTALKLVGDSNIFAHPVKLTSLLEVLRVNDLIIEKIKFREENFSNITQIFLPKLKSCTLNNVVIEHKEGNNNPEEACYHGSTVHCLETLKLRGTSVKVLTFFAGCSQLKSFEYRDPIRHAADSAYLNDFLARQPYLEKLVCHAMRLAWNRLTCFQLKVLDAASVRDEVEAAEFLKKLTNLDKLGLAIFRHPPRRLMQAICESTKLGSLGIWTEENFPGSVLKSEGLENHSVKKLIIIDGIGVTASLLQLFRGAESISLKLRGILKIDLSDVPYATIGMTKKIDASEKIHIKFSPSVVPENCEGFESTVLKFAAKFSSIVSGITIGRESWRESTTFHENLVACLPDYVEFVIYNGADHSERSLQKEDDEPEPKKNKIE